MVQYKLPDGRELVQIGEKLYVELRSSREVPVEVPIEAPPKPKRGRPKGTAHSFLFPESLSKSKRCRKCDLTKPRADFYFSKVTRDKLQSWCKECQNKNVNETRPTTREGRAERSRMAQERRDGKKSPMMTYDKVEELVADVQSGMAVSEAAKSKGISEALAKILIKQYGEGRIQRGESDVKISWL